jgi:hypothetical protein
VSFLPFPLLGVTSPPADDAMPLCRVMLPSYEAKTSSLPLLHLLITFRPVVSPLEPKSKH